MPPVVNACAYAFNYGDDESGLVGLPPGVYGTQTLEKSGEEVAGFIDEVIAKTGAEKVDKLIGLGANSHGMTLFGIVAIGLQI